MRPTARLSAVLGMALMMGACGLPVPRSEAASAARPAAASAALGVGVDVQSFSFASARLGVAATSSGIIETTDGGRSWRRAGLRAAGPLSLVAGGRLLLAGDRAFRATADGWKPLPAPGADLQTVLFAFESPEHGWAWTRSPAGGAVYMTRDGARWAQVADLSGLPGVHFGVASSNGPNEAGFLDAVHGWFTSQYPPTEPGRLYQTADGGVTWSQHKPPSAGAEPDWLAAPRFFDARAGALWGFSMAPPARAWAWTTADAGSTWSAAVRLPTDGVPAVSFGDRSHWYATAGKRLWASSNAGTTWTELPPLPTKYWQVPIQFTDARHGFALVRAATPDPCPLPATCMATEPHSRLLRTDDGGMTWRPITTPPA